MSTYNHFSPYGAFEMKVSYQRNLLVGNISVILLTLIIVSLFWIASLFSNPPVVVIGPFVGDKGERVVADHRIPLNSDRLRSRGKKPEVPIYQGAIPIPRPDEEFIDKEEMILDRQDVPIETNGVEGEGSVDDSLLGNWTGGYGNGEGTQIYPGEKEFVSFEKEPDMYYNKQPIYPRLCKLAGIEGEVIIKVLVGKDGMVIKALVAKSSGHEALDDAALLAAKENKFSPALQNSIPISLWVSYKVTFKIK